MAGLLDWLGKQAKGVVAQVNPFDDEDYNTVVNGAQKQPRPAPSQPRQVNGPVQSQLTGIGLPKQQPTANPQQRLLQMQSDSIKNMPKVFNQQGQQQWMEKNAPAVAQEQAKQKLEQSSQGLKLNQPAAKNPVPTLDTNRQAQVNAERVKQQNQQMEVEKQRQAARLQQDLNTNVPALTQPKKEVKLGDRYIGGSIGNTSVNSLVNEARSKTGNQQLDLINRVQGALKESDQDFSDEGELRKYQLNAALGQMQEAKKPSVLSTLREFGENAFIKPFTDTGDRLGQGADALTGRLEGEANNKLALADTEHQKALAAMKNGDRQSASYLWSESDRLQREASRMLNQQIEQSDPIKMAGAVANAGLLPVATAAQAGTVGAAAKAGLTGRASAATASPSLLQSTPAQLVTKALPNASPKLQSVAAESVSNVVSGAPQAVSEVAMQEGGEGRLESYLKAQATNAVLGAALPAGAMALGAGAKAALNTPRAIQKQAAVRLADGQSVVPIETSRLKTYEEPYDPSRVAEYKARIQDGGQIEPLVVMREKDGSLSVEDGKHRLQAYNELGLPQAPARIVTSESVSRLFEDGSVGLPGRRDANEGIEAIDTPMTNSLSPEMSPDLSSNRQDVSYNNTIPQSIAESTLRVNENIPAEVYGLKDTDIYRGINEHNASTSHPDRPIYFAESPEYAETYGKVTSEKLNGRVLDATNMHAYEHVANELGKVIDKFADINTTSAKDVMELQTYLNRTLYGERLSSMFKKPMPEAMKKAFDAIGVDYIRVPGESFKGTVGQVGHQTEIIKIPKPKEGPQRASSNDVPSIETTDPRRTFVQKSQDKFLASKPVDFLFGDKQRVQDAVESSARPPRSAVNDEIYRTNPELFYDDVNMNERTLSEGNAMGIPRLHVEDVQRYFGHTQDIPAAYKRRTGNRDIDQLAAAAGYDDIDEYVEAIQSTLDSRRQGREKTQKLREMRKDPEIIDKVNKQIEQKRADVESAINEFRSDRKDALLQGDMETVREIDTLIREVENTAGLKPTNVPKTNTIKITGRDLKVQEFAAVTNFNERNGQNEVNLVPLDGTKHQLKNGMVVNKDGDIVGSYVKVDENGNQIAYVEGKPMDMAKVLGEVDGWGNLNKAAWDMDRLIEANAPTPEVARKTQKFLTQFKDEQEALMKNELKSLRTGLKQREDAISHRLPVGVSKNELTEDLFRIMEKKIDYQEVRKKYGDQYIESDIKPTVMWARETLDKILTDTNKVLEKNGFDPIPRRDNYITHIQEDPNFWEKAGIGIREINPFGSSISSDINPGNVRKGIPDEIVGNTENTSARRKWNPFAQTRRGSAHKQDFFEAIDKYFEPMLFNKYMTPSASRARVVERTFRTFEKAKEVQFERLIDEVGLEEANKLKTSNKPMHKNYAAGRRSPLVTAWQEYANILAGKTNAVDRTIIDRLGDGGQKMMDANIRLQGIAGASSIPGSASAALAQTLSLPQTIARDSMKSTLKATKDMLTFAGPRMGDIDPMRKSAFMRARYVDASSQRKSLLRKYTDKASVPMTTIERFAGELSWRSAYNEALNKKLSGDEAIKQADLATKKTLAGRGIGDRPMAFNSKALGVFTQFGLEVNNMRVQFWKDFTPMQKAKFTVSAFAMNSILQMITGGDYLPDYIAAAYDTMGDFNDKNQDKKDTAWDDTVQAGQRFFGETSKFVPGAPVIAGVFMGDKEKEQVFGKNSTMSRFGDPALTKAFDAGKGVVGGIASGDWKKARDSAISILPTGAQAKKSIQGLEAMQQGYTTSADGKVQNVIDQDNPWNWVQATLFGKYSLPGQAEAMDSNYKLSNRETKVFESLWGGDKDQAKNYFNTLIEKKVNESDRKGTLTDVGDDDSASAASASMNELKATLKVDEMEGKKYVKDGIVYKKETDNIDTKYYKEKAELLKYSKSDEAYTAFKLAYGLDDAEASKVSTGDSTLDMLISKGSETGESGRVTKAIGLMTGANDTKKVPDWAKERFYKENGWSKEDVGYAALAGIKADTKLDNLYRPMAQKVEHSELLDTLYAHRKASIKEGHVAAQDTIINSLQKEGFLTKEEAKYLKSIKLGKDGKVVEEVKSSSGGKSGGKKGGKGSKVVAKESIGTLMSAIKIAQGIKAPKSGSASQAANINTKIAMKQIPIKGVTRGSGKIPTPPKITSKKAKVA
ncbi:ParB N-terminal domain-containing protein [Candidatus Saccharibacteria bacterium]|nr:ParB N-terminal domain-containing protein [Candidatus Saccharibacteria bacterium]